MKPFDYQSATSTATASRRAVTHTSSSEVAPQFIAGGTTQIDLMKENVLRPDVLLDLTPILSRTHRGARGRTAHRRGRVQYRRGLSSRNRAALSRSIRGNFGGRVAPNSQYGLDERQRFAENALLVLPRYRDAMQQARAGFGLFGHHRHQCRSRDFGRFARLHHALSRRYGRSARRPRCRRANHDDGRRALD